MLKAFHPQLENLSTIRLVDNLFFVTGCVFMILGLYTANNFLMVYGLLIMFVSLYILNFYLATHDTTLRSVSKDNEAQKLMIQRLNELDSLEKQMKRDLEIARNEMLSLAARIKDERYQDKVMRKVNAEHHDKMRTAKILSEDVKRSLRLADDFISKLPGAEKNKFRKMRHYKIYSSVLQKIR